MLTTILSMLSAPIFNTLAGGYRDYLAAKNTTEAHEVTLAIKEVEAQIAARAEATKLLIVEQGHWSTRIIRPFLAWPVVIFAWKAIVWDKVLAPWFTGTTGTTEALGGDLSTWASIIVIAYFGTTSLDAWTRRLFPKR
jgi:hypothetical protein